LWNHGTFVFTTTTQQPISKVVSHLLLSSIHYKKPPQQPSSIPFPTANFLTSPLRNTKHFNFSTSNFNAQLQKGKHNAHLTSHNPDSSLGHAKYRHSTTNTHNGHHPSPNAMRSRSQKLLDGL
jgi:hypothetical protein